MSHRPLILVTNDDGIDSPGLHAAAQAVSSLGDLLIVAPKTQRTGAGRSYAIHADRTVEETTVPLDGKPQVAYRADVTPAQAVALSVREISERPIDLCISGINYGENVGSGVTISGTVGAAIEAACFGIPAMAVSLETPQEFHLKHGQVDFGVAAHFVRYFAERVLTQGLPPRVDILKIEIPATATPETEWRSTRVSRDRYYQAAPGDDGAERVVNRFSYRPFVAPERLEHDSDIYVFAVDRLVTVSPMTIDLTAPVVLSDISDFFKD